MRFSDNSLILSGIFLKPKKAQSTNEMKKSDNKSHGLIGKIKVVNFIFIFAFFILVSATKTFADPTISLDDINAQPGANAQFKVYVSNCSEHHAGANVKLIFPDFVKSVSVAAGPDLTGFDSPDFAVVQGASATTVTVLLYSESATFQLASGVLLEIDFTVDDGAANGKYDVTIPQNPSSTPKVCSYALSNVDGTVSISPQIVSGYITVSDDQDVDTDGDKLPDVFEKDYCTLYNNPDTDGDGLLDGDEETNMNRIVDSWETDPCRWDTDGDSIGDGDEDANHNGVVDPGETDPREEDTDFDGYRDDDELLAGSDATSSDSQPTIVCVDSAGNFDAQCDEPYFFIQDGYDAAVSLVEFFPLLKVSGGTYSEDLEIYGPIVFYIKNGSITLE